MTFERLFRHFNSNTGGLCSGTIDQHELRTCLQAFQSPDDFLGRVELLTAVRSLCLAITHVRVTVTATATHRGFCTLLDSPLTTSAMSALCSIASLLSTPAVSAACLRLDFPVARLFISLAHDG